MVLCGEGDCSVCLLAFSRAERVPRLLHCQHTFCQTCLEAMAARSAPGGVGPALSVRCPLCRRVTCVRRGLSLQEALWVDNALWEQIPSDREDDDDEDGIKDYREEARAATPRAQWSLSSQQFRQTQAEVPLLLPQVYTDQEAPRADSAQQ
ncbi:tripartite motif-containing protein 59 isoform X1 [Hippocampus comes]|uniref:tripartite motif-containing protein 59 isoform X1 n=1 Tax=Hippocampus comes TaxID=109280 RepID=UPI00094E3AC9|nr:PREDICTED: tripartite motif-containing protein 59-like isoform X1 [Hippocampus comes]XP_019752066.1 PREDICTED: tripartite motif-containing protein 59-like isoform X1 [Hippocampus comes]XP_019752067.1 PREDICTED: tripartite motif-containing protein 59-like isoform X1 [Hippocampus comes]